jgi:hypothetical protein
MSFTGWALRQLQRISASTPYEHLPGYMERWWVLKPRRWLPVRIRLHHTLRSDLERHLHDHPYACLSWVLAGGYNEVLPLDPQQPAERDVMGDLRHIWRNPGSVVPRSIRACHRLELPPMSDCWSLFIEYTGFPLLPAKQAWGFRDPTAPGGWRWWREYLNDWAGVTEEERRLADLRKPPRRLSTALR